ncbi:hypothetical protein RNZ42_05600 [Lacticaseibacillus paracasei]|nr:hypothetical protein RNZ42_05600 [Lacticaseibacillus paracasei]
MIPEVAIAGTPTIDQEAFSNNRITILHAATAVPTTPDALNQNADAYTDSAHVSLRDLFSVAISGVSQDQIVVSNIQEPAWPLIPRQNPLRCLRELNNSVLIGH